MTENQKLREALQQLHDAAKNVSLGQYDEEMLDIALSAARQALAPPTAAPIMELGESLTPEQLDELWGRYPEVREYLKRKMQEKTAAPVGERIRALAEQALTRSAEPLRAEEVEELARAALAGDARDAGDLEKLVELYHDWQSFLEHGSGDDFNAVAYQKEAAYKYMLHAMARGGE